MITLDAQIEMLKESRKEKFAVLIVVGLMCDSLDLAVARLENNLPHIEALEKGSRKVYGKKKEYDIDHDIALKVRDLTSELLPWLKKVAETSRQPEDDVLGLS